MQRIVSMFDAISITTFPLSDFTRATVFQPVAYLRARVHSPSQSSDWARSSRSKNPFLRITRGRAVGSAAAENHEKKGRIDRRNRHVHYALLYGRALLSVRSFSWFPVNWGSLGECTSGRRTASRVHVKKERRKTDGDGRTKREREMEKEERDT